MRIIIMTMFDYNDFQVFISFPSFVSLFLTNDDDDDDDDDDDGQGRGRGRGSLYF